MPEPSHAQTQAQSQAQSQALAARPASWRASGVPWIALAALAVLLDQLTKRLVMARMRLFESIELLPVLDLTHVRNTGAAFSFLAGAGGWQKWLFVALGLGVSIAIPLWLRRLDARTQRLAAAGLALIMGGALGNVIDRLRFGYVVDFVHVHWERHSFPAFNVADSCITVGAGLLLLDAWLEWRRERDARRQRVG